MVALFGARRDFLWFQPSFLMSSRRVWLKDLVEKYVSTQIALSMFDNIANAFILHSSFLPFFSLQVWQVSKKSTHVLWKTRQIGEYLFFRTPCTYFQFGHYRQYVRFICQRAQNWSKRTKLLAHPDILHLYMLCDIHLLDSGASTRARRILVRLGRTHASTAWHHEETRWVQR